MAKSKAKKASQGGSPLHLRARLEYLHKVAAYLNSSGPGQRVHHQDARIHASDRTTETRETLSSEEKKHLNAENVSKKVITASLPRQYISHMRGVSLKSQLRLPTDVKRSFCKRCDLLLVPGVNCVHETRNASKGCKKPWADVFVVRCLACGTEKRFPQMQERTKKLVYRRQEKTVRREGNDNNEKASVS